MSEDSIIEQLNYAIYMLSEARSSCDQDYVLSDIGSALSTLEAIKLKLEQS